MSAPTRRRPVRRLHPAHCFERLEDRALMTVTAHNFSVNELENTPGTIALKPFVEDTAANPVLTFSHATPSQGGDVTNFDPATGTFTYTPPSASFVGADTVKYMVKDTTTGEQDVGTVTLNVDKIAAGLVGVPVLEGSAKAVDLGPNVRDVLQNPALSFTIPTTTAHGGSITNIDAANGTFTYTPPTPTFTGSDSFDYTVKDSTSGASSSSTVVFNVATLIANPDTEDLLKGTTKVVNLRPEIQDVTANPTLQFSIPATSAKGGAISNVDAAKGLLTYTPPSASFTGTDTVTYTVTDTATNKSVVGVLTLDVADLIAQPVHVGSLRGASNVIRLGPAILDVNANPTFSFVIPAASAKGGTVTSVDAARGTFTYNPPSASFTGSDSLTYTVTDTATNVTTTGRVDINVASLLASPVNLNVLKGGSKPVTLAPSIQDVNASPSLHFSIPATSAAGGSITNIDATGGTFTYNTPSAGFTGADTLTYTVTDAATGATATGIVAVNVASVIAGTVQVSVLQGATKAVDLGPAVQDVTTNPTFQFTIPATSARGGTISGVNSAKGTFTYNPPSASFTGDDSVTYTVKDTATGATDSAVVTFDVGTLIARPVTIGILTGSTKNIALAPQVQDVTADPALQFTIPATSSHGGVVSNVNAARGTFTYAPPSASFTGTDTLTYTVKDTATNATESGTVTITIASLVVSPARLGDLTGKSRTVNLAPSVQDLTPNPTLSFTIPGTTSAGGTITNVNTSSGTFTYTPPTPTFTGLDTLTFTVTDTVTHASDTGTVTVNVASLFADAVGVGMPQNTSKTIHLAPGVHDATANPTLLFTLPATSDQGGHVTSVNAADGTFTYTPPSPGFFGSDTLTYSVKDTATGATDSAQVTINVNKAPTSLTITGTSPANGSVVTALPNGQIVVTFSHPLAAATLHTVGAQPTGLLSADPYSIFLIARGPSGAFSGPDPSQYEGGDIPIHANTSYKVNADGTSQITITPTEPLSADVYAISVNGEYTDELGDALSAGIGKPTFYATFLYQPPPAGNSPLQVTGVTAFNGFEAINNNTVFQPDTIQVHFNKPLFAGAANGTNVQLLAKQGADFTVVPSVAAYSPTTDSIYLTPSAVLNPGTAYLIRVAGQDAGAAHVSDDQGYGGPGFPLATTFYDTFTVSNGPVGAGQGPLRVATANGQPDTLPATDVIWNVRLGYASIGFTEPVALSSFGRYSAMLVPASGGLNPTGLDTADVPLNATLAFNPNTNQLIVIPSQPVGNDLYLYELSGIKAALANGQPNPSDPLLNLSGQPAGGGNAPYFKTFELTAVGPAVATRAVVAPLSGTGVTAAAATPAVIPQGAHPRPHAAHPRRWRPARVPVPSDSPFRARS